MTGKQWHSRRAHRSGIATNGRAPQSFPRTDVLAIAQSLAPQLALAVGARSITVTARPADKSPQKLDLTIELHNGHKVPVVLLFSGSRELHALAGNLISTATVPDVINTEEVLRERALEPALTFVLSELTAAAQGYSDSNALHTVAANGKIVPTAYGYAHLRQAAVEAELYAQYALPRTVGEGKRGHSWSARGRYRRHIHQVIDGFEVRGKLVSSRRSKAALKSKRDSLYWAAPGFEEALAVHGGALGRRRWLADRETGTVLGAAARGLITGLANLPAALLTKDLGQRWRYLIGTVSQLPTQLWTTLFSNAMWARKYRDRSPARHWAKPAFLDNGVGTVAGTAVDVVLRLSGSAQAGTPGVAMAEIGGRRFISGVASASAEWSSFSANMLASLVTDRAKEIGARGEPANVLAELGQQSRRLRLALEVYLRNQPSVSIKEKSELSYLLAEQEWLLERAQATQTNVGLRLAYTRTAAASRRNPRLRWQKLRWIRPNLLATAASAAITSSLGAPAYTLLSAPGLVSATALLFTGNSFGNAFYDDEEKRRHEQHQRQVREDENLRNQVHEALATVFPTEIPRHAGRQPIPSGPNILPAPWAGERLSRWRFARASPASFEPYREQAVKVASWAVPAAGLSFLAPPVAPLALGLTASSALMPFFNAAHAYYTQTMKENRQQDKGDATERKAVRELYLRLPTAKHYIDALRENNSRLARLPHYMTTIVQCPNWINPYSRLARVWDAITASGAGLLAQRFRAQLEAARQQPGGVSALVATLAKKHAQLTSENTDMSSGRAPFPTHLFNTQSDKVLIQEPVSDENWQSHQALPFLTGLTAEHLAAAFDHQHVSDLEAAARAEVLTACAAEWLPKQYRPDKWYPPAETLYEYLKPAPNQPTMANPGFVRVMTAIDAAPAARKDDGNLNVDGRPLALAIRTVMELHAKARQIQHNPTGLTAAMPLPATHFAELFPVVNDVLREDMERIRKEHPNGTRRRWRPLRPQTAYRRLSEAATRPGFAAAYQERLVEQTRFRITR